MIMSNKLASLRDNELKIRLIMLILFVFNKLIKVSEVIF